MIIKTLKALKSAAAVKKEAVEVKAIDLAEKLAGDKYDKRKGRVRKWAKRIRKASVFATGPVIAITTAIGAGAVGVAGILVGVSIGAATEGALAEASIPIGGAIGAASGTVIGAVCGLCICLAAIGTAQAALVILDKLDKPSIVPLDDTTAALLGELGEEALIEKAIELDIWEYNPVLRPSWKEVAVEANEPNDSSPANTAAAA